MTPNIRRRCVAEFLGTAFLLMAVVGSGIMAERLSGGNTAVALLANTLATGAALVFLILSLASVSGAHLNPIVTFFAAVRLEMSWSDVLFYLAAQIAGASMGVAAANVMFGLPLFFASTKIRTGAEQWLGEFIASFGLIGVIIAVSRRHNVAIVALSVAAFITAAYWFTSSTSFANPAVTIARAFSDTFAGIRPADAPAFIATQFVGGLTGSFCFDWLVPKQNEH